MINYTTFSNLYAEAKEYDSMDGYAMTHSWQDWMDDVYGGDTDAISDLLRYIYALAHDGLSEILRGRKMTQLSKMFGIPYSTFQKWKGGESQLSEYMLILMGYAMISEK